jgi:hypothetical protein
LKGQTTDGSSALLVEGASAGTWNTITNVVPLPTTGTTISSPVDNTVTNIRFTYTKSLGNLSFDDVLITGGGSQPSFVSGYSNLIVNATSRLVSGLNAGATYSFRVRAVNQEQTSENSVAISVTTLMVVTNAPVEVPVDWIAENYPEADAGQYESIVTNLAANGQMSVWETYVAGLDPTDPTSVLAIAADEMPPAGPNPGEFILQWPSASGRIYRVGSKTNLMEPFIWVTNILATPPINTYTITPPADGAYYRIGVSLEP